MNIYDVNDGVKLAATFTDTDGGAIDPTIARFIVREPSGGTVHYVYGTAAEVINSGTGLYYMTLTLTDEGYWHYYAQGTGTCIAAGEATFKVRRSNVL